MKNDWRLLAAAGIASSLLACSPQAKNAADAPTSAASAQAGSAAAASAAMSAPPAGTPATPGHSIDQAVNAPIGTAVDGEILKTNQNDFYRFDVKSKLRDLAIVRLQNKSITLRPYIKFFDANRAQIIENFDNTSGASVERTLSVEPGETLYVQVLAYNSVGKYTLSVMPQKAYDANEPNDDALTATPMKIGAPIEGSIMDDKDQDWFRVSGANQKTVHVLLQNLSGTLRPFVKVYSATKSQVLEKYDDTPGADLDFTVDIEPGKDFYLEVHPYNSSGKYRLVATPQAIPVPTPVH